MVFVVYLGEAGGDRAAGESSGEVDLCLGFVIGHGCRNSEAITVVAPNLLR